TATINLQPLVQIRNDDVLQYDLFGKQSQKHQIRFRKGEKTLFEMFLEADKAFEKYQYPCILAVITDGIERFPEWVDYIKQNIHRYVIELHGEYHYYHCDMTEAEGEASLRRGREKIEDTFGIKVSTWYVTYGKRKAPEWGQRVCDRMGIKYDIPNTKRDAALWLKNWYLKGESYIPFNHINFHSWHPSQRADVQEVVKLLCELQ
ncbi:unnamed protein product, partial [marine sediment metagenome]